MIKSWLINPWGHAVLLVMLLITLSYFSFSDAKWRDMLRTLSFDYYNIIHPRDPGNDVVIIDIDEESLAQPELGQWPWSRLIITELTARTAMAGAKSITFDMVFAESDRTSANQFFQTLPPPIQSEALKNVLGHLPDNDDVFSDSIKAANNVVTGFTFTTKINNNLPPQKAAIRRPSNSAGLHLPLLEGAVTNLKPISKAARGNGFFFTSAGADGVIRKVPMLAAYQHGGKVHIYPSLALETLRVSQKSGSFVKLKMDDARYAELDPSRFGLESIALKNIGEIPTTSDGAFWVHYAKAPSTIYIPAWQVMAGQADEALKDKIVLVGTSAEGLKDIRSTPLSAFRPGVEVHWNVIDQILQKRFLQRPLYIEGGEALLVFLSGIIVVILISALGPLAGGIFTLATVSGLIFAGLQAYIVQGLLVEVAYPAVGLLILYSAATILSYVRAEAARKAIKNAFGLYISPDFMDELTADPERLRLGGEQKELTVMFTDIRNFTSISEKLSPQKLIHLMNDFLTPMSNCVMQRRGTIDKYMGDAMMAFWNAPLDDKDHARNACLSALEMQNALAPLNKQLKKDGIILEAGIGINTGMASVGNMGSNQRFAYSALGDAVNLSSRLEGQTKDYGVSILIGESTYTKARDLAAIELDLIRVKGKDKPARIYALLGDEKLKKEKNFIELKDLQNDMLKHYRAGDFERANSVLDLLDKMDIHNLNHYFKMMRTRIEDLSINKPTNWEGVFTAETK